MNNVMCYLISLLIGGFFSEEEAKKKIYSVCTSTYTGFGALISEELSYKVKGLIFIHLSALLLIVFGYLI